MRSSLRLCLMRCTANKTICSFYIFKLTAMVSSPAGMMRTREDWFYKQCTNAQNSFPFLPIDILAVLLQFNESNLKDFKKYYIIPASPQDVYNALTNPLAIRLWTGEAVTMSTEPGSEFSLWDNSIEGKNLEFIPDKKMVQQWYFGEQEEPSIVTIILHAHAHGTSVELKHSNIPDSEFDDITDGWNNAYFGSVQEFFE